jgi:hypothetical protein
MHKESAGSTTYEENITRRSLVARNVHKTNICIPADKMTAKTVHHDSP